jgi:hypothetical protein
MTSKSLDFHCILFCSKCDVRIQSVGAYMAKRMIHLHLFTRCFGCYQRIGWDFLKIVFCFFTKKFLRNPQKRCRWRGGTLFAWPNERDASLNASIWVLYIVRFGWMYSNFFLKKTSVSEKILKVVGTWRNLNGCGSCEALVGLVIVLGYLSISKNTKSSMYLHVDLRVRNRPILTNKGETTTEF